MKGMPLEYCELSREEVPVITALKSLYSRLSTVEFLEVCCVSFVTKVRDNSSVLLAELGTYFLRV